MRIAFFCAVCQLIAVSVLNLGSVSGKDLQSEFAYTSNRIKGQTGIYLHSKDGEQFVSAAFTVAEAPSWSPDGRKIAFQAKTEDRWDIYVIDVDSRKHIQLTDDAYGDSHPVWSPNGSTIAFYSDRSTAARIWLIESDGTNLREFPLEIPGFADFSWSPDGTQVVFSANERVMLRDAPRPAFGIDSQKDLFIASCDGTDLCRVTKGLGMAMTPSWSPDGKQIAFALTTQAANLSEIQLHVVNIDGTGLKRVTNRPGQSMCPKWLPDSRKVLFYNQPPSPGTSTPQLLCISVDGTEEAVIDVGESGGYFPDVRSQPQTKR